MLSCETDRPEMAAIRRQHCFAPRACYTRQHPSRFHYARDLAAGSLKRALGRNSLIEPKDVRNGCQMSFIREASGSTAFAQVQRGAPIPFPPASARAHEFCKRLETDVRIYPAVRAARCPTARCQQWPLKVKNSSSVTSLGALTSRRLVLSSTLSSYYRDECGINVKFILFP